MFCYFFFALRKHPWEPLGFRWFQFILTLSVKKILLRWRLFEKFSEYFLHADVLLGTGLEHRHCPTLLQLSLLYLSQDVPTLMEALMKNGDIQPSMDTSVPRGRGTWVNFAGYVPLASQISSPIMVYPVANYRPHLSHCWANIWFSRSQLSHFLLMYPLCRSSKNELTHFLDWMKNTLLYTTNILVCLLTVNMKNCLTPKIWRCATPF